MRVLRSRAALLVSPQHRGAIARTSHKRVSRAAKPAYHDRAHLRRWEGIRPHLKLEGRERYDEGREARASTSRAWTARSPGARVRRCACTSMRSILPAHLEIRRAPTALLGRGHPAENEDRTRGGFTEGCSSSPVEVTRAAVVWTDELRKGAAAPARRCRAAARESRQPPSFRRARRAARSARQPRRLRGDVRGVSLRCFRVERKPLPQARSVDPRRVEPVDRIRSSHPRGRARCGAGSRSTRFHCTKIIADVRLASVRTRLKPTCPSSSSTASADGSHGSSCETGSNSGPRSSPGGRRRGARARPSSRAAETDKQGAEQGEVTAKRARTWHPWSCSPTGCRSATRCARRFVALSRAGA